MSEALPDMIPRTALGERNPRVDTHGDVTLREVTDLALASCALRIGHEDAANKILTTFIGGDLPGPGKLAAQVLHQLLDGPRPMDGHGHA